MSSKKQQIPAIRFKGFTDAWEQRKLGELLTEVKRPIKMKDDESYELVTVKRRNEGIVSRGIFKGKDVLVNSQFQIKTGDYLISKRQVVHGANGIVPNHLNNAIVSNEYLVSIGNKNITTDFLSIISRLPSMYRKFFLSSYGIDIEKLVFNVEDWKKRTIQVPSISEQNQITIFFKQLDSTIALHQRQLDNYKELKKAMLQKLFPKEGEKFPEIRFNSFTEKWGRKKLGEIVEISRGLTYKPEDVVQDGIRVLRSSNINQDVFEIRADDVFVRKSTVNIPEVQNGDILITSANGSTALVGKHAIIDKLPSATVHGGFMLVVRSKQNYFVNAWMSSLEYKRMLQLVQGGNGAIGNLSKSILEETNVSIPSIEEQIQIGNFFKHLDDNIISHQQKINDFQKVKKAMLQQMFV